MSLYDKVLHQTSQIANSKLNGLVGKATTYVVSNAQMKVTEATNKISDTLGVDLPFNKIGASLPSVKDITAQAIRSGANIADSNFLKQQIDKVTNSLTPAVSAQALNELVGSTNDSKDHLVTLSFEGTQVIFEVLPQISEQRSVGYEEVQPVQSPGPFQKFRGTGATVWTLNATFVSRNSMEATINMYNLMTLRGWTKPYFGENTAAAFPTSLGAPPPVLTLNGLRAKLIGPVPVVIQNLTWDWPRDVDYIPTLESAEGGGPIPFPVVMTVSISLYESYSPAEMNRFDLAAFRRGDLKGAYSTMIQSTPSSTNETPVMGPGEE